MTPLELQERFSALVEKDDLDEVLKSKDDILRWTVELNKYLVSRWLWREISSNLPMSALHCSWCVMDLCNRAT